MDKNNVNFAPVKVITPLNFIEVSSHGEAQGGLGGADNVGGSGRDFVSTKQYFSSGSGALGRARRRRISSRRRGPFRRSAVSERH